MASLVKKRGASGAESPFWQAILSFQKRKVWVSTRCRDKREARKVGDCWTKACVLAQEWRLNQTLANKLLADIAGITKCPRTLDNSRELFKRLLAETTGEVYAGESFSEFCEEWLCSRSAVTKASTLARYQQVVRSFIGSLPDHRKTAAVASIQSREIRLWRDHLVSDGLSESTCNVALIIVRGLFGDGRKQGILTNNPAEAVPLLRAANSDERIPFTVEQIKALLAVADTEWQGMILVGWCCGLRLGDAAALRWSNVDLVARTLSFEAQKTAHRKKKHQRLTTIYLHDDVVSWLTKVGGNDDPDAPLLPSLHGVGSAGLCGLSGQFISLMKRAGIESPKGAEKTGRGRVFRQLSFHSLRHSFCSRLANAEISMEVRKALAGHSSDQVHSGYSHLEIGLQRSAITKLTSVL